MSARDVILERVRQAVAGTEPAPISRAHYRHRGLDTARGRRRGVRGARPRLPSDRRADERCAAAVAEVLAAQGARRVGDPTGPRPRGCGPPGVELVEDAASRRSELDGLDGALTTCAAACAVTGTIALDGGPGQGRRALTLLPDLHVCVVRDDQIVETVPELVRSLEEPRRKAARSSSSRARPRPPTSSWNGSRASTARAGSS